nr:copper amine oxidase N-terminal domain-containing protein [Paenibacillus artemisiicola]
MLLPMRALAEAFGWRVTWDAAHKAAMIASQPKPPAVNPGGAGELSLWVNGKRLTGANAKPVLVKGSVYLPLRATAGALGLGLTWTPAVNGALLTFKPAPLREGAYAGDPRKLAAVKVLNGYVEALNARDGAALEKLFAKDVLPAPDFGVIGQRLITGIRAVTFQNRPGGALLADVTFGYLFDPRGNRTGGAGLVLTQEDGAWRIADVD